MTAPLPLYEEAAAEIKAVAESLAESHRIRGGADMWDSDAPRHEYVRLMDLARRLRARAIEGPCLCMAKPDGSCERCGISAHRPPLEGAR